MNVMSDSEEERSNKRMRRSAKSRIIEDALIEMKVHKNKRFELKEISRRERFETKQRQRQQHHEALMLQEKKRLLQSRERFLRLRLALNKSRDMKKKIIQKRKVEIIDDETENEDENETNNSSVRGLPPNRVGSSR
jgi:hypothetical protein